MKYIKLFQLGMSLLISQNLANIAIAQTTSTPISANSSSSNAASASNSSGTTVNQQQNTQINNSQYVGFGAGIQCPITNMGLSVYGGGGNGDTANTGVSSTNYGMVASISFPLSSDKSSICKKLGEAQLKLSDAQTQKINEEAAKLRADINLVTINQCINILKNAKLSGRFADLCDGVNIISNTPETPRSPSSVNPEITPSVTK